MQRSKVDQSVHPLLKLALLIENGGIMVNQPDTAIFGSSLDWLQEMFFAGISANHYRFRCHPMKSFVFLLEDPISDIKKLYSDAFVGSVPRSHFLEKVFDTISSFIT